MKRFIIALLIVMLFMLCLTCVIACRQDDGKSSPSYQKITVDYENMTYVGTSLKNFSSFFDEQELADPKNGASAIKNAPIGAYDIDCDGDIDEEDKASYLEVTVDLKATYNIESIYIYYHTEGGKMLVETGTPFAYESSFAIDSSAKEWNKVDVSKETRYVNIKYENRIAPSEIVIYGEYVGNPATVNTEPTERKTMGYLLGMNANYEATKGGNKISCTPYIRDYINWLWFYEPVMVDKKPTTFNAMFSQHFTGIYLDLTARGHDTVPCFMFSSEVVLQGKDKNSPEAYAMYGELLYQVALRFGNNPSNTRDLVYAAGLPFVNKNCVKWIEAGNEPNGEGNDGFTPYQIAALTSVSYDAHCNTVTSLSGSRIGVKNADPNIKLAMAGLAGVGTRYIQAMTFWMEYNRADGKVAMDAFNVHTYCRKTEQYNGYTISYGVAPEVGGITDEIKKLTAWRDMYYPEIEVWLTEFGWDTNESWETENACHSYGEFSARELQAMWLVRAYFMFAGVGVDRCAMYMCQDLGNEETSVGKYGTSGVVATSGEYKDSYYYLYTIKNTMSDMYFAEIIDSGNENVWIYRFENGQGKSCYALWCPTMDSVTVDDYVLNIDGASATLTEFANKETSGISSSLTVTNGTVTVDVSERPVLVFSGN